MLETALSILPAAGLAATEAATTDPAAADSAPAAPAEGGDREARLRDAATRFESVFLAEMLRHAGFGKERSAFGGGAGEAAFSGTLIQEYATKIAESGGLGLADSIFAALIKRGAA